MLIRHRPVGPLATHVDMLWFAQRDAGPHARERNLPTGRLDIVIPLLQDGVWRFDSEDATAARHLRGAVVNGAHDRYFVRGTAGPSTVIGVHFRPGGAAAFFGGAVGELYKRTVRLEDLWGPLAGELRERLQAAPSVQGKLRLLEDALLARLAKAPPPDAQVAAALHALAREPANARVTEIQIASGCSAQAFIRRFELAVGLTPKRHARILRFNALLARLGHDSRPDWAQLAVESGYFDQSHLGHEFRRLSGLTPTAYAPLAADQPMHVAIERHPERAGGIGTGPGPGPGKNLQDRTRRRTYGRRSKTRSPR